MKQFKYLPILSILLLSLAALFAAGCAKKQTKDVEVKVVSYDANSGAIVDIPKFVQKNGEELSSLDKLNRETDKLINLFDDAQQNEERRFECHVVDTSTKGSYVQTTCWWNEFGSIMNDGINLMTLAYDMDDDTAITCKEALKMTELTGVDLVQKVTDAYKKNIGTGQVTGTDMQGFKISKKGKVTQIYMKLTVRSDTDGTEEEHFYSFHIKDSTLTPLNEKEEFAELP